MKKTTQRHESDSKYRKQRVAGSNFRLSVIKCQPETRNFTYSVSSFVEVLLQTRVFMQRFFRKPILLVILRLPRCRKPILLIILQLSRFSLFLQALPHTHTFSNVAAPVFFVVGFRVLKKTSLNSWKFEPRDQLPWQKLKKCRKSSLFQNREVDPPERRIYRLVNPKSLKPRSLKP